LAREAADSALSTRVGNVEDTLEDIVPTVNSLDTAVTTLTGDANTSGSVLNTVNT